jgi:hypothetical protein
MTRSFYYVKAPLPLFMERLGLYAFGVFAQGKCV